MDRKIWKRETTSGERWREGGKKGDVNRVDILMGWAFVEPCRMTLFLISVIFSMNSHSLEIPMCVVKHLRATPTYLANYLKVTAKLIRRDVLFKGDG